MGNGTRFHYVGEDPIHPIHPILDRSKAGSWACFRSLGIPLQLRALKSRISCHDARGYISSNCLQYVEWYVD